MKALSLFSNVGIGEYYLNTIGIDVVVANELEKDRAAFYQLLHPNTKMICGDITDETIYQSIIEEAKEIDIIIATPPCQGMSIANAKRSDKNDPRNSLIKRVVQAINDLSPKYILIENVPEMAKTCILDNNGNALNILEYVAANISSDYVINHKVLNACNYKTAQNRKRIIVLISKKDSVWHHPEPDNNLITVRNSISHLPSLESGEKSNIPWHYSKTHNTNHVLWMKNTPTGKTAFDNPVHFPQVFCNKINGFRKISGFKTTYKRIDWDKPSPTITMCNGSITSQNNVHPGNLQTDGTYSDARVLTVREISILCGLPENWLDQYDGKVKENFVREVIGECFPPKMALEIFKVLPALDTNP